MNSFELKYMAERILAKAGENFKLIYPLFKNQDGLDGNKIEVFNQNNKEVSFIQFKGLKIKVGRVLKPFKSQMQNEYIKVLCETFPEVMRENDEKLDKIQSKMDKRKQIIIKRLSKKGLLINPELYPKPLLEKPKSLKDKTLTFETDKTMTELVKQEGTQALHGDDYVKNYSVNFRLTKEEIKEIAQKRIEYIQKRARRELIFDEPIIEGDDLKTGIKITFNKDYYNCETGKFETILILRTFCSTYMSGLVKNYDDAILKYLVAEKLSARYFDLYKRKYAHAACHRYANYEIDMILPIFERALGYIGKRCKDPKKALMTNSINYAELEDITPENDFETEQ